MGKNTPIPFEWANYFLEKDITPSASLTFVLQASDEVNILQIPLHLILYSIGYVRYRAKKREINTALPTHQRQHIGHHPFLTKRKRDGPLYE